MQYVQQQWARQVWPFFKDFLCVIKTQRIYIGDIKTHDKESQKKSMVLLLLAFNNNKYYVNMLI